MFSSPTLDPDYYRIEAVGFCYSRCTTDSRAGSATTHAADKVKNVYLNMGANNHNYPGEGAFKIAYPTLPFPPLFS